MSGGREKFSDTRPEEFSRLNKQFPHEEASDLEKLKLTPESNF